MAVQGLISRPHARVARIC